MLLQVFSLPLKNPVLIFSLILFIILLTPVLLQRLRIPDLIGLIIAGAVIGPNGVGIMERDSSIELFGTVGLLYIMFIAGLEIDMADLKKNYGKTLTFGLYTFLIPMIVGTLTGVYWLDFSWPTSILLASMYASHTLITYPIVSKYGITKNRAVSIAIGGTVITCILALLVLAVIVGMSTGEINQQFWIKLGVSSLVFISIVVILFPMLGRWFFKRYEDSVGQYIFVLALVFFASFLAEAAGLEAIIGAFLAGLALNRLIPNTSALMNRIDFVGNAIFIPFFLIGVGMLVDVRTFAAGWTALWVAVVMTVIATLSKFMAAWITEKNFKLTRDEGRLVFISIVVILFPMLGRWFFKRYEDSVGQYIFVLALVFFASFLAEAAGLEAIIGAFLAGLALNRLIPNTSALMNRIDFVGNAIFIPFFLIGVGMLVDVRTFAAGWTALWVAVVMTVIATLSKFMAAWITEKNFKLTRDEGRLIFGLSNAQAAATLAAVLIGYEVILGTGPDGQPIRLLNEDVLNGTIVMILITCTIASFITQRSAQNIALAEMSGDRIGDSDDEEERILIPLSNSETVDELITLGTAIKSRRNKAQLVAVSIVKSDNTDPAAEKISERLLEKAVKTGAGMDHRVDTVLRYDLNIVNGIRNVAKEHKITDIVIGLRTQKDISDTFLGKLTQEVLSKCATTTLAYRPMQPMSTVKRYIVVIPENAEKEVGFPYWLISIWNLAKNVGTKIVFYGTPAVLDILHLVQSKHLILAEFKEFTDWSNFKEVATATQDNDALILVMSRPNCPSYSRHMEYVPNYINKYFNSINCILVYPVQLGMDEDMSAFRSISMINYIEGMDGLVQVLGKLFRKNK